MRFLLILFVCLVVTYADDNILCLSTNCANVECDDLPEKCRVQNATHNGVIFPSPDICNCCSFCLENIAEGEECTVGDPSTSQFTKICGPGLTCITESDAKTDGICGRMSTDCAKKQDLYDEKRKNGNLGSLEVRPDCDDDGDFAPYTCIPGQSCYCQTKDGTRIFGEADYSTLPNYMACDCPRRYHDAVEVFGKDLHPNQHFRCDSRGDYDVVQCIGSSCLCVDVLDGAPTYPDDNLVNMTKLNQYTLRCYTNEQDGVYYKDCERVYLEILQEIEDYEDQGFTKVFDIELPKCDLDGTYSPVQENVTHKMCVDKNGRTQYAVSKVDQENLAETMNCYCARAVSYMTTDEKPICAENGNYEPIQCRKGLCRCVDENGNQACSDDNQKCEEVDEINVADLICPRTSP